MRGGHTYLARRDNGHYYLRLRLAAELRRALKRADIRISLGTTAAEVAASRLDQLLPRLRLVLEVLKMARTLRDDDVRRVVSRHYNRCMKQVEEELHKGTYCSEDDREDVVRELENRLEAQEEDVADGQSTHMRFLADHLLRECGLSATHDEPSFALLCRELLRTTAEITDSELRQVSGGRPEYREEPPVCVATPPTTKALSVCVQEYVAEQVQGNNWTAKTRQENEAIYRLLIEVFGDPDIAALTQDDLNDAMIKLRQLPANASKFYPGMTVTKVLAQPAVQAMNLRTADEDAADKDTSKIHPIDPSTTNKYARRIKQFLRHARDKRWTATPLDGKLAIKVNLRADEARLPYEKDELQQIVDLLAETPSHRHLKWPQNFWITLIGMLSGMRLDEVAQLHVADIKRVAGVLCFHVHDDPAHDRAHKTHKLKTNWSRRDVPVHSQLLQLGFKEYVAELEARGEERLWPDLRHGRDGYAAKFGRWFEAFNRNYITPDKRKVFHSFRHNMADALDDLENVSPRVICDVLGQKPDAVTFSRYAKSKPKQMQKALDKVTYRLDFTKLPTWLQTKAWSTERADADRLPPARCRRKRKTARSK